MTIRTNSVFPNYTGQFRKDRPGNVNAGGCTLCRSSKVSAEKPAVELGNNARPFREGMVVLCFNCAVAVGTAVGMLSQADAQRLIVTANELRTQVDHLNAELEAFVQLRDSLEKLVPQKVTA